MIDVALGGRVGVFQITRTSKVCELALHKMRYTNSSLVQKIGNPMKPDVYEAGARVLNMMEQKKKQVRGVTGYATNTLEIMVTGVEIPDAQSSTAIYAGA